MKPINVLIFSDYAWPFCYIGKGIAEKLAQEFPLEITWMGYELRPERPPHGELLSKIMPGADVAQVYARFNQTGAPYGLEFNPVDFIPNTRLALMATEYAKDLGKFEEFHNRVFKAYFTEGQDIGKVEVLLALLDELGILPEQGAAAIENAEYARRLAENRAVGAPYHVVGLPTFIIEGKDKIVGAQTYEMFKGRLEKYC